MEFSSSVLVDMVKWAARHESPGGISRLCSASSLLSWTKPFSHCSAPFYKFKNMRGGPTVFCSQITSSTFLIQRKIARRLRHTATSITKECKHMAHGENVYNKYSWSAFHENLREMSVMFIFPTICKVFLNTYFKIEPQIYGSLTHCILFLVKAFRSSTEFMGLFLIFLGENRVWEYYRD